MNLWYAKNPLVALYDGYSLTKIIVQEKRNIIIWDTENSGFTFSIEKTKKSESYPKFLIF